jgi:hypothetical protein
MPGASAPVAQAPTSRAGKARTVRRDMEAVVMRKKNTE